MDKSVLDALMGGKTFDQFFQDRCEALKKFSGRRRYTLKTVTTDGHQHTELYPGSNNLFTQPENVENEMKRWEHPHVAQLRNNKVVLHALEQVDKKIALVRMDRVYMNMEDEDNKKIKEFSDELGKMLKKYSVGGM